jgi:hypothetical protein
MLRLSYHIILAISTSSRSPLRNGKVSTRRLLNSPKISPLALRRSEWSTRLNFHNICIESLRANEHIFLTSAIGFEAMWIYFHTLIIWCLLVVSITCWGLLRRRRITNHYRLLPLLLNLFEIDKPLSCCLFWWTILNRCISRLSRFGCSSIYSNCRLLFIRLTLKFLWLVWVWNSKVLQIISLNSTWSGTSSRNNFDWSSSSASRLSSLGFH